MFTGDAYDPDVPQNENRPFKEVYDKSTNKNHFTYTGKNADKYRFSALAIGINGSRIGINSEIIRRTFQNEFAHDYVLHGEDKWFRVLDTTPKAYFYFGTSNPYTLW
jgi:Bacterial toxin 23